jgi:hypothetical protein
MNLAQYRSESIVSRLSEVVSELNTFPPGFQRAFLETVYSLYPKDFTDDIIVYLHSTDNPRLFAMSALYVLRADALQVRNWLPELMNATFPDWRKDPIISRLNASFYETKSGERPPLTDLLRHDFGDDYPVFFSFHREDRSYAGLTVLRKSDGTFKRNNHGNIEFTEHLARSVSGLPGYITNGNTPQGIYSLKGTDVSENVFIGPTPNIQLRLPFETGVVSFFHHSYDAVSDTGWTVKDYERLLPSSWISWGPIYEAYYAGKAGRSEIIAHGTTIDPEFYTNLPCYPFTPSLGCLTALELWSRLSGECLYSGQVGLLETYRSVGESEGFFVLVELNDLRKPVVIGDVLSSLLESE